MKTLLDFNLRESPFQYITPIPGQGFGEPIPWAGMPDTKEKISRVYSNLVKNLPRQVILNWGPYGGGKTFTAYHFMDNYDCSIDICQVYIRCPKQGSKASLEFYRSIIDFLSFRKIHNQIRKMIELLGEDKFFNFIYSRIRSEEITNAIILIGSNDENTKQLMHRYVYDGLTKIELKKVGLPKNIDWGSDRIKFLSGVISSFIGDQDRYEGRFVLWLDEMEDMVYYSQKEYKAFSQVLRDLMDSVNQYFAVFMNFTFAEPEEKTIELLLGGALWSRINTKIRFKELSKEDALEYCNQLIYHYQADKKKKNVPFTNEILQMVFEFIPNEKLTPREINRYRNNVLNQAMDTDAAEISIATVAMSFEQIVEEE